MPQTPRGTQLLDRIGWQHRALRQKIPLQFQHNIKFLTYGNLSFQYLQFYFYDSKSQ